MEDSSMKALLTKWSVLNELIKNQVFEFESLCNVCRKSLNTLRHPVVNKKEISNVTAISESNEISDKLYNELLSIENVLNKAEKTRIEINCQPKINTRIIKHLIPTIEEITASSKIDNTNNNSAINLKKNITTNSKTKTFIDVKTPLDTTKNKKINMVNKNSCKNVLNLNKVASNKSKKLFNATHLKTPFKTQTERPISTSKLKSYQEKIDKVAESNNITPSNLLLHNIKQSTVNPKTNIYSCQNHSSDLSTTYNLNNNHNSLSINNQINDDLNLNIEKEIYVNFEKNICHQKHSNEEILQSQDILLNELGHLDEFTGIINKKNALKKWNSKVKKNNLLRNQLKIEFKSSNNFIQYLEEYNNELLESINKDIAYSYKLCQFYSICQQSILNSNKTDIKILYQLIDQITSDVSRIENISIKPTCAFSEPWEEYVYENLITLKYGFIFLTKQYLTYKNINQLKSYFKEFQELCLLQYKMMLMCQVEKYTQHFKSLPTNHVHYLKTYQVIQSMICSFGLYNATLIKEVDENIENSDF